MPMGSTGMLFPACYVPSTGRGNDACTRQLLKDVRMLVSESLQWPEGMCKKE